MIVCLSDILKVHVVLLCYYRDKEIIQAKDAPTEAIHVMATCHALVQLDDEMVGDPLEKATLKSVDYTLTKGQDFSWVFTLVFLYI